MGTSRRLPPLVVVAAFAVTGVASADDVLSAPDSKTTAGALIVLAGNPARGNTLAFEHDCVDCHGLDGRGTRADRPNLGGQNESYLRKQLEDFVKGRLGSWLPGREHKDMSRHAVDLSDQDVADLAVYYAGLPCQPPLRRPSAEESARPGIAARCEICHKAEVAKGRSNMVPRIAGQNADYLKNQIASFQRHARHQEDAAPEGRYRGHPMMDRQAAVVTPDQARALARYFSAQSCR